MTGRIVIAIVAVLFMSTMTALFIGHCFYQLGKRDWGETEREISEL